MAEISNLDLRTKLETRLAGLRANRKPWEPQAREIARFTQTRLNAYVRGEMANDGTNAGSMGNSWEKGWTNNKLFNSRAVTASEILGNGMSAGLCSPSQPWFKLTTEDPDLMEYQPVKEYLAVVEKAIYSLLARCGFYPAATSGFLELGRFGVEACLMTPHWEYGAACFPQQWGGYWIGQNDALRVDTLYRRADMTVAQMYAKFPQGNFSRNVTEAHTKGHYDRIIPVMHAIEPNIERVYGKMDKTNMAYRSVYWEPGEDKTEGVISFGGFEERPFWAPRWNVGGSDTYADTCPGMRAYPESRKVQLQELNKQQIVDQVRKPALYSGVGSAGAPVGLNPGQVTYGAMADRVQVYPLWTVDPSAIGMMREEIEITKQDIDVAFYADLFKAFIGAQGSAYKNIEEIARKHEEQLTQLGPVVDRAQNEKLDPVIDQAFNILLRSGQLPDPPEELAGQDLKVQLDGVLAQAQRIIGLGAIERTAAFVGNLGAAFPGILDKIDPDQTVDEYAALAGAPPKMVRSDEKVAEVRQARAQAEQQEKMLASMPAIESGAKAAQLLSETDTGSGRSALQALVPGV